MKQIVEEYWSFDGSIQEVIRMFLKSNPNYKVAHLQLATTQQHGVYALVIYEYIGKER